ncbi:MAG: flagellar hook-basal body complex protein FliE [Acidobacteria bacterium]|nr:flagellar hook-basal body complex protein FliE [Acidobacteriota bacterium]
MKIQDSLNQLQLPTQENRTSKKADGSFGDMLQKAINDVNQLQKDADTQIKDLITGESQDMHKTIMAVQQADTSFKVMMQVRNKIIEAYKEISRSSI